MKNKLILLYYSLSSLTLIGQIDLDNCGNYLDPVEIGQQTWMATNLNTDKFANGDQILEAKSEKSWIEACTKKQAAWCYFENKSKNGKIYGKLYNWYAVNDPRGLAPKGWRIPTAEDVEKLNKKMWKTVSEEEMKIIKDAFKRNFIGSRHILFQDEVFVYFASVDSSIIGCCQWWSSYEISESKACAFSSCYTTSTYTSTGIVDCNSEYNDGENKGMGYPVRCILEKK